MVHLYTLLTPFFCAGLITAGAPGSTPHSRLTSLSTQHNTVPFEPEPSACQQVIQGAVVHRALHGLSAPHGRRDTPQHGAARKKAEGAADIRRGHGQVRESRRKTRAVYVKWASYYVGVF